MKSKFHQPNKTCHRLKSDIFIERKCSNLCFLFPLNWTFQIRFAFLKHLSVADGQDRKLLCLQCYQVALPMIYEVLESVEPGSLPKVICYEHYCNLAAL